MLTVTAQQMQALAAPHRARFHRRIRDFLAEETPELAAEAGAGLDEQIAASCATAAGLGCASEQEQVLFVVLSLLHGLDFTAREDWARQVVADHQASGRQGGLAQALMRETARQDEASQ